MFDKQELKSQQRSIRMTPTVESYVLGFEGNGFNQKFENLVIHVMNDERNRKERIKKLDKEIKEKIELLDDLRDKIQKFNNICLAFESIDDRLKSIDRYLDELKK